MVPDNWEIAQILLDAKADATAEMKGSTNSRMVCALPYSCVIHAWVLAGVYNCFIPCQ